MFYNSILFHIDLALFIYKNSNCILDMAMRIVISQRVRSWVSMVAVHTFSAPKPFKVKDKNQEQLLIDFDTYITTGKDGATDHTYRQ